METAIQGRLKWILSVLFSIGIITFFGDYPGFNVSTMKHFCKRLPERKTCHSTDDVAPKGFEEWVPCCSVLEATDHFKCR